VARAARARVARARAKANGEGKGMGKKVSVVFRRERASDGCRFSESSRPVLTTLLSFFT